MAPLDMEVFTSPGVDPAVITVGATKVNGTVSRADDTLASYSAKGPTMLDHIVKPDLVAPGNKVVSLLSAQYNSSIHQRQNQITPSYYSSGGSKTVADTNYFMLSGTSMAAAHASGAAALLVAQYPNLTPDQIKAVLMVTATKFGRLSSTSTDAAT